MTFQERLEQRIAATGSHLCIGLDPRREMIDEDLKDFLFLLIDETEPVAAAYKPNMAYFEVMGSRGIAVLEEVLAKLKGRAPVILDCKRSDIGETQKQYARAYFENWDVDAVTLNPYLGFDSLEPFLEYQGKGVYLLGVTSNPGAADFQRQKVGNRYVFELAQDLIRRGADAGHPATCGLVVGLTNMTDDILARIDDVPLLVPGLGAQGGDLEKLAGRQRKSAILVNVSRGVMFGDPHETFADRAGRYAEQIAAIF